MYYEKVIYIIFSMNLPHSIDAIYDQPVFDVETYKEEVQNFFLWDFFLESLFRWDPGFAIFEFSQRKMQRISHDRKPWQQKQYFYPYLEVVEFNLVPNSFFQETLKKSFDAAAKKSLEFSQREIPHIGKIPIDHLWEETQHFLAWGFGTYLFEKSDVENISWDHGEIPADYIQRFFEKQRVRFAELFEICKNPKLWEWKKNEKISKLRLVTSESVGISIEH